MNWHTTNHLILQGHPLLVGLLSLYSLGGQLNLGLLLSPSQRQATNEFSIDHDMRSNGISQILRVS